MAHKAHNQYAILQNWTISIISVGSFDALNKTKSIKSEVFEEEYQFLLFDVESFCMNVPRYYFRSSLETRVIETNLKKRTLKKYSIGLCTKTAISHDNLC